MNQQHNFDIAPARRSTPSFAPAQNTAVNKPLQDDAAPIPVREAVSKQARDFTLSVDEIRIRLHDIGISKSKDTIQRYCREGDLDCQKLGMFKRYFATEFRSMP